ncbi:MAG TPA: hypothetical protein VGQ52_03040 [Gemmatimonadaceae bacterium]|jgi:mercuric reductase|nr:hypothetical protein [Gemmatimonadaceae bacterium]
MSKRFGIVVNDFLTTSNPSIYAAGDVPGDPMFVYVPACAGTVAAENALSGNVRQYDLTAVPRVTFSDPAVASGGLTDEEARQRGSSRSYRRCRSNTFPAHSRLVTHVDF